MNKVNEGLFDTLVSTRGDKSASSKRAQARIKSKEQDAQSRQNKDLRNKLLSMGYDPDTAEIIIFRSQLEPEITELLLKNVYNYTQVALIRAIMKNTALKDYVDEDGIKMIDILNQTNPSEVNLQYLVYVAQNKLPFFLILNKDFKTYKSENRALSDINNYKSGKESYSDQAFSKEVINILDRAQKSGYNNDLFLSLKKQGGEYLFYSDETLNIDILKTIYLAQAANVSGQDIKNILLNSPLSDSMKTNENILERISKTLGADVFEQINQIPEYKDGIPIEEIIKTNRSTLIKKLMNKAKKKSTSSEIEDKEERIVGTIDNKLDNTEDIKDDS